jgi:hypothetical protein
MESVAATVSSVNAKANIVIDTSKVVEIMPAILASVVATHAIPTESVEKAEKGVSKLTEEKEKATKDKVELNVFTKEQQEALDVLFVKAKAACETIIHAESSNNAVKLTQIIGHVAISIEQSVKSGIKLLSVDKKIIAMELCRRIIKDAIDNKILQDNILFKFNCIGDEMLESIIHISKNINIDIEKVQETIKQVEEVAITSCAGIKNLFSKK